MSKRDALMSLAELRRDTIELGGQTFTIQEPSAAAFQRYAFLRGTDAAAANAVIIQDVVVDDAGNPILSEEDARAVGRKNAMCTPIVMMAMRLADILPAEDPEKKD